VKDLGEEAKLAIIFWRTSACLYSPHGIFGAKFVRVLSSFWPLETLASESGGCASWEIHSRADPCPLFTHIRCNVAVYV